MKDAALNNEMINEGKLCCKICGEYWGHELSVHIIKRHKWKVDDYKDTFGVSVVSETRRIEISNRIKGSNNPGYQHDGRLSPFSSKFIKENHDPQITKKKAAKSRVDNNGNTTNVEYYTSRGYSKEEAELLRKKRQTTFSLEKCIKKYGLDEGTERWNNRQKKWQETLNSKSEEEKARINAAKFSQGYNVSSAEKEIANLLKISFNIRTQIALKHDNKNWFVYDIMFNNKIIEYNGDYWHCNPKKYNNNQIIRRRNKPVLVQEVWDKDIRKIKVAEEQGYKVMVLWESDFKKNKEESINKCIQFLTT